MTISVPLVRVLSLSLALVGARGALATEAQRIPACGCQASQTVPAVALSPIAVDGPVALTSCDAPCKQSVASNGCDDAACDCRAADCDSCAAGDCCSSGCEVTCAAPPCTGKCGCDCLRCCDKWSVFAGAMFLNRSDAGNGPLIVDQNSGDPLARGSDLGYGTAVAPSITLVRELSNCWGWSLGYFGTDGWNSSVQAGGNISPSLVGPGFNFPSTAPGTVFRVDGSSSLHSAEFNLRRRCNECVTWLAGFRWMEFGDDIHGYTVAPAVTSVLAANTTNHLYGFQIGADSVLVQNDRGARIEGIVRAGLMGNHIDHTVSSPLTGGFGTVGSVRAEDDVTSFVGILGLQGVLPLSRCWSAYGGYQVMWLDGVALAADNIQTASLIAPGSATIDTGTVFFHGATVGLQASF